MFSSRQRHTCIGAISLTIIAASCTSERHDPVVDVVSSGSLAAHYTVIARDGKDVPHAGIQHRYVHVVLRDPTDRKLAERVLKEVYHECKSDIETTQPKAQYKRIHIRLFDIADDAKDSYGSPICWVFSSDNAGPTLPAFENAKINWKWRDGRSRPTPIQIGIYREYRRGRDRIRKSVEAPYYDSHGILRATSDDELGIEAQVKVATVDLVAEMCQRHGMSKRDFARLIAYVWEWIEGRDTSEAQIDDAAAYQLEQWTR